MTERAGRKRSRSAEEQRLKVIAPGGDADEGGHPGRPDEGAPGELRRLRQENRTLYAVINTVASSLDVDRVLDGIVGIATEATASHACFVYFVEGDRLTLRAASPVYRFFVGRLSFGLDEGVAGWVARTREPAFIREGLLADPRVKFIPELEEERFQSMVAVPVCGRSGEVIGVIVLHTVAPREFDEGDLNFLVHTASLVAGAIENAQIHAGTRRRLDALTRLTGLSRRMAAATTREALFAVVAEGARELLDVEACSVYRLEPERGELALAASDPPGAAPPRERVPATGLLLELLRGERPGPQDGGRGATRAGMGRLAQALFPDAGEGAVTVTAAPLTVSDEHLGILCVRSAPDRELSGEDQGIFGALAELTAVALKKAELIERLTAEDLIRDTFEALAADAPATAEARAASAGFRLGRPHLFLDVQPAPRDAEARPWAELADGLERRLRQRFPSTLVDTRAEGLRAIVPVPDAAGEERLRAIRSELEEVAVEGAVVGISGVAAGVEESPRRLREAADAATIARALRPSDGALRYDELGAYKYLVHLDFDAAPRDRYWTAVEVLLDYDLRRQTHLVSTLEQFLRDRRSVVAAARALYVHPNTLRQRLRRIEKLSGLDVASEDLLSLELAVKLVRLHHARR